jgi:mRNA interferase MazF
MVGIEKGQSYWCSLDPVHGNEQGATRPVVIVSADFYNRTRRSLAAIIPLTKAAAKTPVHLTLQPTETGLSRESTVLTDNMRFVDRTRLLGSPIGRVTPDALVKLEKHLIRLLGLAGSGTPDSECYGRS